MKIRKITDRRFGAAYIAVSALFVVAAASQAKLQTVERDHTISLANDTRRYVLSRPEKARRGAIFAADGQPLARDESLYDLDVDFSKCPASEAFWMDVADAAGIPATEFEGQIDNQTKMRVWPQCLSEAQRTAVDEVRRRWRANGVSARATGRRDYPLGEATACLVGVIREKAMTATPEQPAYARAIAEYGQPSKGQLAAADVLTGIERSQDAILRGQDGTTIGVTDRNGQFLPMRTSSGKPMLNGKDLTLTLDSSLQQFAAEQVKHAVEMNQAESGSAVIEDPRTGDILAIANWPGFTPYTSDGSPSSLGPHGGLNQTYMSVLEPGSMFKILTLAKALDCGVVHMSDTFVCPGEKVLVPHSHAIKCDDHGGNRAHGLIDPIHAIAKSCNIWAATWALQIGRQRFFSYLDDLGVFTKPDIGAPGAIHGLFNKKDPAKQLQLAMAGFGQSINCTPVALAAAFSTLANKGVRMAPRLIARVGDQPIPVKPGKVLLKASSCENVIQGMEAVFEDPHGTGRALKIPGYLLAGKTGTAQKVGHGEGHVSNFVGFVPAENPVAVIVVMIDKPGGQAYYGASVAGPVFKEIAKAVIRRYHLPPNQSGAWVAKTVDSQDEGSPYIPVVSKPDAGSSRRAPSNANHTDDASGPSIEVTSKVALR